MFPPGSMPSFAMIYSLSWRLWAKRDPMTLKGVLRHALGRAADLWNFPSISSLLSRDTVLTVAAHDYVVTAFLICRLRGPEISLLIPGRLRL